MTLCLNGVFKNTCNLLSKTVFHQIAGNVTRNLYSPSSMGIDNYLVARERLKSQFHGVNDMFFQKMKEFVHNKENSMIFTEDLKTMCHLIDKKSNDLNLLYEMLRKFESQKNLRFGNFVFGPVVMRTLYFLDEPDFALKIFKDPELDSLFDQIISYQLIMDLLYNHGKYADVREIYDSIKGKNINGVVHPKNPLIIVMGACYNENTKESYEYALNLFKTLDERGYEFPRRSFTFLAALALNQNDPTAALEIISLAKNQRYIDIRCIKLIAYAALDRIDEIMVELRIGLEESYNRERKILYFKDTVDAIEAFIERKGCDDSEEVVKLVKQIKTLERVQDQTLHEHIIGTIDQVKIEPTAWKRDEHEKVSNSRNNRFNQRKFNNRRSVFDNLVQNY